jgi:CRISPR-associated protein Csb2
MLALGIRYLNGFVAATHPDDYDRAEWPPHPGRIFMALAAAHFQTGGDPEERDALLWLENLKDAPAIKAPEAHQRAVVTHYVPVNDKAGPSTGLLQSAPVARDRQPRTFARAWLEDDKVFLLWPHANPKPATRGALERLCGKVTRIGHSSSLVQMWLTGHEDTVEPTWCPDDERPAMQMRLATPGTLDELERRYNAETVEVFAALKAAETDSSDRRAQKAAKTRLKKQFPDGSPPRLRPQLRVFQGYARPGQVDERAIAPGTVFSPHPLIVTLEPQAAPYRYLDLVSVLPLTARWRAALCSCSNDLPDSVRTLLSGHDAAGGPLERSHLAFLPLGFVGSKHADGRLLGMALALPGGLNPNDRRGLLTVLGRVRQLALGRMGLWTIRAETSARPPWNLRPETWTAHPAGATRWATVTPVVYDRHPKSKDTAAHLEEVTAMIRDTTTRIGLPEPRDVIVTSVSVHSGAPPAHAFPRLQRKDGSQRRHTHAILLFEQPVCGPVVLGAGRYRGYGLCRPMGIDGEIQRQIGA